METSTKTTKSVMYLLLAIIFIGTANAQTIDLNTQNPYQGLTDKINEYPAVEYIAQRYDLVSVEVDDYKLILDFENNKLKEIREFNNELVDLELTFTRDEITYLIDNWQEMGIFDRLNFFLKKDVPIQDIISFASYMVGMR